MVTGSTESPPALPIKGDQAQSPLQRLEQVAAPGWRAKAVGAFLQILAGTEKGAAFYGEVRDRLDTIEGRSIVSKGLAEATLKQAVSDPEMLERARARFLGAAMRKQDNLETVLSGAANILTAEIPDQDGPPSDSESPASSEDDAGSSGSLDEDWATSFTNFAENASSDELRDRLSRVLAEEIKKPGRFSRATVRCIFELEKVDLEAVKEVLPYVLDDVVVIVRNKGQQAPSVPLLLKVADAGLTSDPASLLAKTWPAAKSHNEAADVTGSKWVMRVTMNAGATFSFSVVALTKAGMAVVDFLGRPDEVGILTKIANANEDSLITKFEIAEKISDTQVRMPWRAVGLGNSAAEGSPSSTSFNWKGGTPLS